MSAKKVKPRLSKSILEMKFMQRTKAKVVKDLEDEEGREMYSNEITTRMQNGDSVFITEPSFARCESLIEGRLSFRGMNPEIERLLELEQEAREAAMRPTQKKEVEDDEMIEFYAANSSMHKKFNKGQPKNKKRLNQQEQRALSKSGRSNQRNKTFIKPKDEDE